MPGSEFPSLSMSISAGPPVPEQVSEPPPGTDLPDVELPESFLAKLRSRGLGRRRFLQYCAVLTGALALPTGMTGRVATAFAQTATSPTPAKAMWLAFQDCTGCVESFLRCGDPDVASLLLGSISLNYSDTLMAAAGTQAEAAKAATIKQGGYLLILEGAIPTGDHLGACTIGGRSAQDILKEAAANAAGVVVVGSCASFGGIPAANPNPTDAVPVHELIDVPLVNVSGCPPNGDNIAATIAHFLTFGSLPAADRFGRPLFAYGDRIHDTCDRRAYFDAGQFALEWDDEGHRQGYCLYKLGCKGPSTFNNCSTQRWNQHTSWPVMAGHGCVGCSEPQFWDADSPFYGRLPNVSGFGAEATADQIGKAVVIGTAALFAGHGVGKAVQHRVAARKGEAGPAHAAHATPTDGSRGTSA